MPTPKSLAQVLSAMDNYLVESKASLVRYGIDIGVAERVEDERYDIDGIALKSKALLIANTSEGALSSDINLYTTFINDQRALYEPVKRELQQTVEIEFARIATQEPGLWEELNKQYQIKQYQSLYISDAGDGSRAIQMLVEALIDRDALSKEVDIRLSKNVQLAQHPEKYALRREQAFKELLEKKKEQYTLAIGIEAQDFWREQVKQGLVNLTPPDNFPENRASLTPKELEQEKANWISRAKKQYVADHYSTLVSVKNTPLITAYIKNTLAKTPDFVSFMMGEFGRPVLDLTSPLGSACNKVVENTLMDARDTGLLSNYTYLVEKLWTVFQERDYQLDYIIAQANIISQDPTNAKASTSFRNAIQTLLDASNTLVSAYIIPLQLTVDDEVAAQKDIKGYLQYLPGELQFLIDHNAKSLAATPISMQVTGDEVSIAFSADKLFMTTIFMQGKIHAKEDVPDFTLHFTKSVTEPYMRNARLEFNVDEAQNFSQMWKIALQNYANNTNHGVALQLAQAKNSQARQGIFNRYMTSPEKIALLTDAIADFKVDTWLRHRQSIDTCREMYKSASIALKNPALTVSECAAYAELLQACQKFINEKAYVNHITPYKTDDMIREATDRVQALHNKVSEIFATQASLHAFLGENPTDQVIVEKFKDLLNECSIDEDLTIRVQARIDSFVALAVQEQAKPTAGEDIALMAALTQPEVLNFVNENPAMIAVKETNTNIVAESNKAVGNDMNEGKNNTSEVIGGVGSRHSSSVVNKALQLQDVTSTAEQGTEYEEYDEASTHSITVGGPR